jgi:hypothetical protein
MAEGSRQVSVEGSRMCSAIPTLGPGRHAYPFGKAFRVRVTDDLRRCVVFFGYPDATPGKGGIHCIGTGFLLEHDGLGYLSTAAHLAHALGGDPFLVRFNKHDGTSENVHMDEAKWYFHSDPTVDVAVAPLFIDFKSHDAIFLGGESLELTKNQFIEENIGIGDLTYTVGLFRLLSGEKRNLPICHSGSIALFPSDEKIPVIDWRDASREKIISVEGFLVETHSLQGLSGSPVFVRPQTVLDPAKSLNVDRGAWRPKESRLIMWPMVQLRLLGLWQGSWDAPPDQILATQPGTGGSRVPIGMGVVVPCYKIVELLDSPEVKEDRDKIIAQLQPQMFMLEHGKVSETPINAKTKRDFNDGVDPSAESGDPSSLYAQSALLCDSLYMDVVGRAMLIGVYSDDFRVFGLPTTISVTLFLRIAGQPGTYDIEYRAIGPNDASLLPPRKSKITLSLEHSYEPQVFQGIKIQIQSAGWIKFQWKPKGRDWETLVSCEVKLLVLPETKPPKEADLNGKEEKR